jgi:hypothetical protein
MDGIGPMVNRAVGNALLQDDADSSQRKDPRRKERSAGVSPAASGDPPDALTPHQ